MKSRPVDNVALLFGSLVLGLVFIELCCRVAGWGDTMVFTQNDAWGYLMTPSQRVSSYGHPVRINKLGFRGPEVTQNKQAGVRRIVYLGDSVTYGGGRVREEDLFCRVSEAMLNRQRFKVDVVNISAPGWSPQNWVRYAQVNGLLNADLVVVVLPECDLDRPFATMEYYGFKASKPFLRTAAVAAKLNSMIVERMGRRRHSGQITSTPEASARANLEAVASLIDLCSTCRTDLLFVFIPSLPPSGAAKYWPLFDAVAEGRLLDLRHDLSNPRLFFDGVHLSAEGHKLVGERLCDTIKHVIEASAGTGRVTDGPRP